MTTRFVSVARLVLAAAAMLCGLALARADTGTARGQDTKIALVIGNSDYVMSGWGLDTAARDASDMAKALKQVGFAVVLKTNVGLSEFTDALNKFSHDAESADIALFYFAGHGIQFKGENYFLPVDVRPHDNIEMKFHSIKMSDVAEAANYASKTKIIIIDACRNSVPDSTRTDRSRSVTVLGDRSGLAQMRSYPGMIIFYSAQFGATALDKGSNGVNSPFAQSLLGRIAEPSREIRDVFGSVTSDVQADTKGRQVPEMLASLTDDVILNPAETDASVWKRIKNLNDLQLLKQFVKDFPDSDFVEPANIKIGKLTEDVCLRDAPAIAKLQAAGNIDELKKIGSASLCPSTAARVETAIAAMNAQRVCEAARRDLDAADQRSVDALVRVRSSLPQSCDKVVQDAGDRIVHLKEAIQQACRAERARIDVYARDGREKLVALLRNPSCASSDPDAERDLRAFDARVGGAQRELARLGCLSSKAVSGQFDEPTVGALATYFRAHNVSADPNRIDDAVIDELHGQRPGVCVTPEQIAEACARDRDAIQKLEAASNGAALRAFGAASLCKASRELADAAANRLQLCIDDQQRLDKTRKSLDAVTTLRGQLTCEKVRKQADDLAVVLTEKAKQAACQAQRDEVGGIDVAVPGGRNRLTAVKTDCPAVRRDLDASIKALDDRIAEAQRYLSNFACLKTPPSGRFDVDTVDALAAYRVARKLAAREPRIDADLFAEFRSQRTRVCAPVDVAAACANEAAQISRLESAADVAGLQALASDVKCGTSRRGIDEATGRVQTCLAEQQRFDAVDKTNLAALRSLKDGLKCERTQQVAAATIAKLEDVARRQTCDAESAQLAAIDVYVPKARLRLSALRSSATCPEVRADIAVAIAELDKRIAEARRELESQGCLKSSPGSDFDAATIAALKSFREARGLTIGEPRIDQAMLDDLQSQRRPVCLPPAPEQPSPPDACLQADRELEILEDREDVAAIRSLGSRSLCPTANPAAAAVLARVERCGAERRDVAESDRTSVATLKALLPQIACYKVEETVSVLIARLEDGARKQKQACEQEDARIQRLDVSMQGGVQELVKLRGSLVCAPLAAKVEERIQQGRALITNAQKALGKLGCLGSPPTGDFDASTAEGLSKYAKAYSRHGDTSRITEALITQIEQERANSCSVRSVKPRPPQNPPPQAEGEAGRTANHDRHAGGGRTLPPPIERQRPTRPPVSTSPKPVEVSRPSMPSIGISSY